MRKVLLVACIVPFVSGCTLLGISGGKTLPPRPMETPKYIELLREHVDLATQAASRFDAVGAEPASPETTANLAVTTAVRSVIGSPLYPLLFEEIAENPNLLDKKTASLKSEKAEHVDAEAAWQTQTAEIQAKLQDALKSNGVLSKFTGAVTMWVRWIGAAVLFLATLALVARAYFLKQNQLLAILTGVIGVIAIIAWIWLAGTLVKIALWGIAIAAIGAAAYGAYVLFSSAKTKEWLDRQIKAIQALRTSPSADAETVKLLENNLDEVSNPSMRGYVDERKEALNLPRATS